MQYREIVAVTGMGGLFHLQATKADGAIVRSLSDNSTKFVPARLHNVTPLESIEVYTSGANVRLHEVLQAMKDSTTALPDVKKGADAAVRAYFKEVYPDLDDSRVYTSDLKKMVKWFELLKGADLLDFSAMTAPKEAESGEEGTGETAPQGAVEDAATPSLEAEAQLAEEAKGDETGMAGLAEEGGAPAKKSRSKKAAESSVEEGEEKPAKKAAPRKKKADGESTGEGDTEAVPKKAARKKKDDGEAA